MAADKKNRKKHPDVIGGNDKLEEPAVVYAVLPGAGSACADPALARPMDLLGIAPAPKASKAATEHDFIAVIREGIYKKSMDRLMKVAGLTASEMAGLIHTSDRTLRRYQDRHKLNPEQSERLIELARLYARGEEVFEDMELFKEWMGSPSTALGNMTPKSFLDTSIGIEMLLKQLLRIEHGVYS